MAAPRHQVSTVLLSPATAFFSGETTHEAAHVQVLVVLARRENLDLTIATGQQTARRSTRALPMRMFTVLEHHQPAKRFFAALEYTLCH